MKSRPFGIYFIFLISVFAVYLAPDPPEKASETSFNYAAVGRDNTAMPEITPFPFSAVSPYNGKKEIYVYPSGRCCGVKLITDGVLVISSSDRNGLRPLNGSEGVLPGDFIKEFNGITVRNTDHLVSLINENKNAPVTLTVKRGNKLKTVSLSPFTDDNINYFIGLWVRDSTAGLGTLTYFSKDKSSFAALGHSITDVDTNEIMSVGKGRLVESTVISVKKGSEGDPGELVGVFKKPEIPIGTVTANNDFGLFGEVTNPSAVTETEPVPAASKEEIKTGPAEMICTVNEKGPEKYKIEILRINRSDKTGLKNMVIEVTDETLIEKTGGIVQGMSGSPIIQNGKLIGAVTHVFLNDPKRGYGIFIENMLE